MLWLNVCKIKNGETISTVIQKIVKKSNGKPNKIWVDKKSHFYNKSIKL